MTKTQRTILFFLPIQAAVLFFFYYLTTYWLIGLVLQVVLGVVMMHRLFPGGNRATAFAKAAQPSLLLVFMSLYSVLMTQLYGVGIPYFILLTIGIVVVYATSVYLTLQARPNIMFSSILALILTGLTTSFLTVAMAYWRLPGIIALPLMFITSVVVGLWWLLGLVKAGQKNMLQLAVIWGLLATEILWIYSHWIVVYQLPRLNLVVSQSSIILMAMAYSIGGIYYYRLSRRLTPQIILEYLSVSVIVCIVTLVFTRWVTSI